MYIAIGLACAIVSIILLLIFLLWKANYCSCCCKKHNRSHREFRNQHSVEQANRNVHQEAPLIPNPSPPPQNGIENDNFVEIPILERFNADPSEEADKKCCWGFSCFLCRKKPLPQASLPPENNALLVEINPPQIQNRAKLFWMCHCCKT